MKRAKQFAIILATAIAYAGLLHIVGDTTKWLTLPVLAAGMLTVFYLSTIALERVA